ncbi:MAG: T9SS type A sorting domain-containing protein [Ignavibacteriae bacterium]|nr:T9SS C-terminal target domain-containing protein [Ignavibacteriota bacterium]NOG99857.1 T9SS type A sorting domain-containing protein [Ignavibacteriota bacterium]
MRKTFISATVLILLNFSVAIPQENTVNKNTTFCYNCIEHPSSMQIDELQNSNDAPDLYLYPYNLHLKKDSTSSEPLVIKDKYGNIVPGTIYFGGYSNDLISISADGYVTGLREEQSNEIGTWVFASIDGQSVSNRCVVRVLSSNYNLQYIADTSANTILYYPESINGENIEPYVLQYEMSTVHEYIYQIQAALMDLVPFGGNKQILEVDFGETEQQRVCGISGNPVRLGWNIQGNPWQNCFLVPFTPPRSPQWFIITHEIGHNFTLASNIFYTGLSSFYYSEGIASSIGLECYEKILARPEEFTLQSATRNTILGQMNLYKNNFQQAFNTWQNNGSNFSSLSPDIVDGIYFHYKADYSGNFTERFYTPLQMRFFDELISILNLITSNGENGKHTFFAALISAAVKEDLSQEFITSYNYPIIQSLFDDAYTILSNIMDVNVAVGESEDNLPNDFVINQNYPNPFNPTTTISYSIPIASQVQISIYNTLGQIISTLIDKYQSAGYYETTFDASNLSSGVYFYSLKAEEHFSVNKMILLK